MKTIKKQAGFTLVELAIVLVIVGLLLAGVLKGQELIESGRVRRAASDLDGIAAAYTTYLDRYKALPGDDGPIATFTARAGSWTALAVATGVGNQDGAIVATAATTFTATPTGSENELFFRHLKAANLLTGDPAATLANSLPTNAWGGKTGIVNVASIQGRAAVAKLLVCLGSVPGKAAAALDRQLDDGLPGTGTLRATLGTANTVPAAAAASYAEDQVYTVCRDSP
jgi:prepilin-type N-terminal cleavage/methylation domain-containing protein